MKTAVLMDNDVDYFEFCNEKECTRILYGIGNYGKNIISIYDSFDFICDEKFDLLRVFKNIKVISPNDLNNIDGCIALLISVKNVDIKKEIIERLKTIPKEIYIFDAHNNDAFDFFEYRHNPRIDNKSIIKYVRIVNHDKGGILSKFAERMQEELSKMGIQTDIESFPNTDADINYYTIYNGVIMTDPNSVTTFMITHVNSENVLNEIKHHLKSAQMGICMSRETMEMLVVNGVPRTKLCYINPAQDGIIKPKKNKIGIFHKCYDSNDYRKRASALLDIVDGIDTRFFDFIIMGEGWDNIVQEMKLRGFDVTYYPEFEREIYSKLMPTLDYYMYWGFDEGSMGYLDALAAGLKTIVTPQGYHLDTKCGITYPCRTIEDFNDALLNIEMERKKIINSVSEWTWENFARKHLEVWEYLLGIESDYYSKQHFYEDGIFSVFPINIKK